MAALLALAASLTWGTGDFLGGRASRSWSPLVVLWWSQLATLLLMWGVVGVCVLTGFVTVEARVVLIGAAGGCAGVIALASFYKALAIGPMAVVPPIAASGVVLPIVVGLASGDSTGALVIAGLAVSVIGIVLAATGSSGSGSVGAARIAPSTLLLCLVAATGFALIFVALDVAAGDAVRTALVATAGVRLGSFSLLMVTALLRRSRPWRGVSPGTAARFAGIGVLDTGANLLFASAAALGALEVVAVLGSLYPAVTSGLAHVVLGERLGRIQLAGVVIALAGFAVLAVT